MAEQLTLTNGISLRSPCAWMAFATNSLPVPLSPLMRTLAPVRATLSAAAMTFLIAGESPITVSVPRRAQAKTLLECGEFETALHRHHNSLGAEGLLQEVEGANLYGLRGLGQR